jgi:hypothetical protein
MFRRAHTLGILRSALRLLDRGTDPAAAPAREVTLELLAKELF